MDHEEHEDWADTIAQGINRSRIPRGGLDREDVAQIENAVFRAMDRFWSGVLGAVWKGAFTVAAIWLIYQYGWTILGGVVGAGYLVGQALGLWR
jgi:hypothetical protein